MDVTSSMSGVGKLVQSVDGHPLLYTVEEAAGLLRIGRTLAYALARRYERSAGSDGLPVVRLGNCLRSRTRTAPARPPVALNRTPSSGRCWGSQHQLRYPALLWKRRPMRHGRLAVCLGRLDAGHCHRYAIRSVPVSRGVVRR